MKKILALTILLVGLLPFSVFADSAGPNGVGTGTNNSSSGTTAWTNPGNITLNDSSYAICQSGVGGGVASCQILVGTNFSFSIPSTATIIGIQIDVNRHASANGFPSDKYCIDSSVKIVKGGSISGNNEANTTSAWPTTDTFQTYGGSTDLWGLSWTPTDINASNFGMALQASYTSSLGRISCQVNYYQATIFYTTTPVTPVVSKYTIIGGSMVIKGGSLALK